MSDTPTLYYTVNGVRYPFIEWSDLTSREIDWIERQCNAEFNKALEEGRQAFTVAAVAVAMSRAEAGKRTPDETVDELWEMPSGSLSLEVDEPAKSNDESGPTKPARTRAKSAASGSQK